MTRPISRSCTTTTRASTGHAFTLIELLVVVAVISVLIAILLPALGAARERAKKSACLANLRSLSQADRLYAMENNDRLPNLNAPGVALDPAGATAALIALYNGYAHNPKVFHCPSDRDPAPADITTADFVVGTTTTTAPNSARTSYDFYNVYWAPERGPRLVTLDLAPLVWDIDGGNSAPDPLQNHGTSGGNVAFSDGHAEWQPCSQWDHTNPAGLATYDWPHPANQFYQ